jgi:hypothetical protein
VNYLANSFSNTDFFELTNFCRKLDDQECYFALSNSSNPKTLQFASRYKVLSYDTKSIKGYNLRQVLITNSPNQLP